jgi:hypothetical protein
MRKLKRIVAEIISKNVSCKYYRIIQYIAINRNDLDKFATDESFSIALIKLKFDH